MCHSQSSQVDVKSLEMAAVFPRRAVNGGEEGERVQVNEVHNIDET